MLSSISSVRRLNRHKCDMMHTAKSKYKADTTSAVVAFDERDMAGGGMDGVEAMHTAQCVQWITKRTMLVKQRREDGFKFSPRLIPSMIRALPIGSR